MAQISETKPIQKIKDNISQAKQTLQDVKALQAKNEIQQTIDSNLNRQHRIRDRFLFDLVPGLRTFGQSKTKQSFAQEADINNIMSKYVQTGVLVDPLVPRTRKPVYGDFSQTPDYFTAKNNIIKAEQQFQLLPSKLRDRFENNLENLVAFIADEANHEECVKLGLKPAPLDATVPEAPTPLPNADNASEGKLDPKTGVK